MKWLASLMMLVVAATMFSACGDDNSGDDDSTAVAEYVNATIDGTAFASNSTVSTQGSSSFSFGGVKSSKEILITLPAAYTLGTHTISSSGYSNVYKIEYYPNLSTNGLTPIAMTSGTITITEINATNHTVKGTFTGTNGTYSITNGTFCMIDD